MGSGLLSPFCGPVHLRPSILFAGALCAVLAGAGTAAGEQASAPRRSFAVPLAHLGIARSAGGAVEEVIVSFGGDSEIWAIGPGDDRYQKSTRRLLDERIYQEPPGTAYLLSSFEAGVLDRVFESLVKTLELFERDLRREHYERLRYLDAYFPAFMKGFHHLLQAAWNSSTLLAPVTDIATALFNESYTSLRTDARVRIWEESDGHRLKLRIAARETQLMLEQFRRRVLANHRRDPRRQPPEELRRTWELFVRLYFNLRPYETPPPG